MTRGEVRRLSILLQISKDYQYELLKELEKPRSQQEISVDHVLEATKAATALRKQSVLDTDEEEHLRRAIVNKFRTRVITNTVGPRKLIKLAQAISRKEVPRKAASRAVNKIISEPHYSIDDAFKNAVEKVDFEHSIEQLATRLIAKLEEHKTRSYKISESLASALNQLAQIISTYPHK